MMVEDVSRTGAADVDRSASEHERRAQDARTLRKMPTPVKRVIQRLLPSRQLVCEHRRLRWATASLNRADLWSLDRRRVAAGLAAGVFWGLLVPFGQFFAAGAHAFFMRWNLPAALLGTFASNPFTVVPIYAGAYWIGSAALGVPPEVALALTDWQNVSLRDWLGLLRDGGLPLIVGLALLASSMSLLLYGALMFAWRVGVWRSRKRRYTAKQSLTAERALS